MTQFLKAFNQENYVTVYQSGYNNGDSYTQTNSDQRRLLIVYQW